MSLVKTDQATFDAFIAAYPNALEQSIAVFYIPVTIYMDKTLGYFPKNLIAKKKVFSTTILKDFRDDQFYKLAP